MKIRHVELLSRGFGAGHHAAEGAGPGSRRLAAYDAGMQCGLIEITHGR